MTTTNYQNKGGVVAAGSVAGDVNVYNNYSDGTSQEGKKKRVLFGYYESWSEYSKDEIEKYSLEDIDVKKLTHVAYAYIKLNDDGSLNLGDIENYQNSQRFKQFIHLKRKNPELKLLISLGGMESSKIFPEVFADDSKLQRLNKGLADLIKEFKFDGLDLVWIYPTTDHRALFVKFFKELRKFDRQVFGSTFILSAAISPDPHPDSVYDLKELEKHLDFFNIFTYGFLSGECRTEHNAPLHKIKKLMREWITKEIDFNKILLGVELGGKEFRLKDPENNEPNSECTLQGTLISTLIKSFQIQKLLETGNWTTKNGPNGDFVYSYCGDRWITYEDETSIQSKTKYACDNQMAGVVVMALNYEGNRVSPLLDAIIEELNK